MENTTKPKVSLTRFFWILITLAALAAAGYLYYQNQMLRSNPQNAAQKEVTELVSKVSKLIVLPNEAPTVATVSDPEKLKDQAFFASAEKGDKVLIYTQAKKAYLFSVRLNKILEVAPLNIGAARSTTSTQ
jgi:hypothetical protein